MATKNFNSKFQNYNSDDQKCCDIFYFRHFFNIFKRGIVVFCQDHHEVAFVGDEACRQLSQFDPKAVELLDKVTFHLSLPCPALRWGTCGSFCFLFWTPRPSRRTTACTTSRSLETDREDRTASSGVCFFKEEENFFLRLWYFLATKNDFFVFCLRKKRNCIGLTNFSMA